MSKENTRIVELLEPFTGGKLPFDVLGQLQAYLDLLLKWNARMNLTAVRDPEQIVARHFGESLFAAKILFGDPAPRQMVAVSIAGEPTGAAPSTTLADVGSGAGFPGVPMKLWAPHIELTLIESQNKKAIFLREVLRTLKLDRAEVFCGRAEEWGNPADVVTLRAVEQFERALPVAAKLVAPGGNLGLLIGSKQVDAARALLNEHWSWRDPVTIPQGHDRVLAIAAKA